MVRFIIEIIKKLLPKSKLFYIPIWLDLLSIRYTSGYSIKKILHSNMVRFIIGITSPQELLERVLHSNMVRFIIRYNFWKANSKRTFYIPIWLDLL